MLCIDPIRLSPVRSLPAQRDGHWWWAKTTRLGSGGPEEILRLLAVLLQPKGREEPRTRAHAIPDPAAYMGMHLRYAAVQQGFAHVTIAPIITFARDT